MSRNYGSLGRRSSAAVWQWVIIGMIMGFGCSVMFFLGALAFGVVNLDGVAAANLPTQTPFVITATPEPVTPTEPPAEPTPTEVLLEIQAPTASPTTDPTMLTLMAPTETPDPLALPQQPGLGADPLGSPQGDPLQPLVSGLAGQDIQQPVGGAIGGQAQTVSGQFDRVLLLASELLPVEGGTFQMGTTIAEVQAAVQECLAGYGGDPGACELAYGEDSFPQHPVTVSPFLMERTEVSYEQYLAFMNALGPGSHRNGCFGQPCMQTRTDSETSNITFDSANYSVNIAILNFPMTNVTWYGAQAYCQAIGRRLPTEAEWERAARGNDGRIYPWGNSWDANNASTRRPASGEPAKVPVTAFDPVGASPFGILNMAGNVAEWVFDWYDPRFYSRPEATLPDPQGPATGQTKVVRGGSWDTVPFFTRTVHRQERGPLDPTASIGFRCVADIDSVPSPIQPQTPLTGGGQLEAAGGSAPAGQGLIDPSQLGVIPGGADEEITANAAPTLPPRPTAIPAPVGTLDPGG
ncbi:MAG: SUMF1/EgtB/PvdO family nonheme iron enzyme [Aggregatilineales bacterium]